MAPQNNLPGSVDIINQKTGDIVVQYAQDSDRVVNLTATSIVRVHASPESVNFYEREGNDLIVHMKDGSTVRYQSFFTLDSDGLHSELVFEDNLGTHHAAFPYAAEAGPVAAETIVPAYSEVAFDSLVGGSGISALGVLGGIAAVGGIVGVAAAAGGGGGGGHHNNNNGGGNNGGGDNGGGNNGGGDNGGGNNGGGDNGGGDNGGGDNGGGDNGGGEDPGTPTLSVQSIASDNIINLAEISSAQLLSGTTEAEFAGSTIRITANGQTWTTTVNSDGSWGVWFQPSTLQSFAQGLHSLRIAITTKQGVTVSKEAFLTISTTPPELELTPFAPGGIVDQEQHVSDKIVRGYVKEEDAGSTIIVILNNRTYTALADANGQWQLTIPKADMALLEDGQSYTIIYRAIDSAGNITEEQRTFSTNFSAPDISVDPIASDNIINSAEILLNQTVSGETSNIPAGQIVTITLNGKTYYAEVLGDGTWKATLPSADLAALANGNNTLTVTVNDANGNTITDTVEINVDTTQPGIAIAILSTDDYLSASEALSPLEVHGITTVKGTGATIIVTINGKEYVVNNIDVAGKWSVTVPSADLLAWADGPVVITATVTDGNQTAQDQHTLNVQIHHLPTPIIDVPFGDGYLNAEEKGQNQVLSGNTGVTSTGQNVTVQVGGKTYKATVDNDGTWKVTIPAGDLQHFPDGLLTVVVNASDASGNSATLTQTATVDTQLPALSLLPLTADGKLNAAELGQNQTLSGISSVSEQGQTVTVTLNGKTYTTVVGSDGNWQLSLPAADLGQLQTGNYPLTVTLKDAAGNTQTVTQDLSVKTTPLVIGVQALTDGNTLDAAEIKVDQILHGTSNAEAGSIVSVTIGGTHYQTVTDVLGNWQVTLSASTLQSLGNGAQNLNVSITDTYGQTHTINSSFNIDTTGDAIAISIISADDYLNYTESQDTLTIRGNSAGLPEGTLVTITLNGKNYLASIAANGSWQANVPAQDLAALADGLTTVTATVITANGTVIDSHNFTVAINNLPSLSLDPAFGDNVVNATESSQSQVLTGNTGVTGAGQVVVATLNGQQYQGVVASDGSWTLTLPPGAMQNLTNGANTIEVVVSDVAGNTDSSSINFSVDKVPPALTVTPFNGNDVLNSAAVANGVTLSGTTSVDTNTVVVNINGTNYQATVTNGSWSLNLGNAVLGALPTGSSTYTVTATDNAGNSTSTLHTVNVDTRAPNVVVDPITADNTIDTTELDAGFHITGKTVPAEVGATVEVNINGTTLVGVTAADGSWSIKVDASVVSGLTSGTYPITVTVTDSAGNASPTQSTTFAVDTTASAIIVNPIESDNKISAADIADGLTISGTSTRIPENGTISITLFGKVYTTTVNASGFWQLTVPKADAENIADGTTKVTVSALDVDGNPVSVDHQFIIITHQENMPEPTIHAPFGDGIVNAAEAEAGGNLSGNTGAMGAGQVVTVQLDNGTQLSATVDANGNWTLPMTAGQLGALGEGGHTITVTATDAAGNQVSTTTPLTIDTVAPTIAVNSVTSDNIVNTAEVKGAVTISGTGVFDPQHDQIITVLVNGQNYDALLQPDGTWSITMPAGALSGVADGPVSMSVTITDYAGNSTTVNSSFTLDASAQNAPQILINPVSGDSYVNADEADELLTISGTTLRVESGQTLTVTLNGKEYTTLVGANGSWSVDIDPADLANVPDGKQIISVTVADVAGNPASANQDVTFIAKPASQPTISINNTVAQDDVINALEHNQALDITGSSSHLAAGAVVTVSFNGKTYTGSVDNNGNWKVTVPQADVQALNDTSANNPYVITATAQDPAQNPASATHDVTVDTSAPTLVLDLADSFLEDGRMGIPEAAVDQQISGNGTAGETIVVTINGKNISTVVDEQGNWTVTIPASELQALPQGDAQITFSSTDANGNTSQQVVDVNVKTTGAPTLTLNTMFGNNIVSIDEAQAGTTLTGSATGLANGTAVVVTVDGQTFTGTVSGGSWSVNIGAGKLADSGQFTVTVTAEDAWGNPANVNGNLDVVLTAPTATLPATLFGDDNLLSQAEANAGVQITGATGQAGPGQTVTLIIDGSRFTGIVDVNGNWTVSLTPQQLGSLIDGDHTVSVSVTDRAGNTTTSPQTTVTVRTDALPEPQLTQPFTDGILSLTESDTPQTIGGQLNLDAGLVQSVMVSINNGEAVAATINSDGSWSLDLDSATLKALPDGVLNVNIIVTDIAGNQVTGQGSFEVITHNLPQANYITPFDDLVINNSETLSNQLVKGNTGVNGPGQTVSVTLGNKTYPGTVAENGEWTVTIPKGDLAALNNGDSLGFSVTVTDRAGNETTATSSTPVTVQTELPTPTVTNPFGDGVVNISEAAGAVTLNGTTGVIGPNQFVTVKIDIDGVTYTANVDSSGNWTLALPAGTLQNLAPGQHAITIFAEDQYGNSASNTVGYQVALTPPAVTITTPAFGDGVVSIDEATAGTELRGSFSSSFVDGTTVKVTIGDQTFNAVVNGTQWSLALSESDWSTITARGPQTIVVTVVDGAQNSNTATVPVTLLLDEPTVSVTQPFAGDNALDYLESLSNQSIGGTSSLQAGDTIRITFGGGATFTTTVQEGGSWTLQLTPAQMATLAAGPITVEGSDRAGNVGSATNAGNLTIDLTPPPAAVNMDLVAGDNYVNGGEFVGGVLRLSGHAYNLNGTVTISSGGTELGTAVVNADGSWTFDVPRGSLPDGTYTFTVTGTGIDDSTVTYQQTVIVDTVVPTLTITQFTGDNLVNSDEKGVGQTITGTSDANGSQVTVTLNGKTYYGQVVNGSWSVTVPQGDMAALNNTDYTITATIRDAAGNPAQTSQTFTVDANAPLLEVDALGVPAVLNTVTAATGILLQGQGEPGNTVTITLGPLSWSSTVDGQGRWSHTFPQLDLSTLTDGAQVINISSTDAAGNTSTNNISLNVALNKGLGVVIDQVFNDGILNVAESLVTQLLTGKVSGDYRGAKVSLTIVGTDITINDLLVGPDGTFSIQLPPSLWTGLLTDTLALRVDVVDANGNTRYETIDVGLALTDLPVVGNVLVAVDNFLNKAESGVDQLITGTVSNVADVSSVVLNFAGRVINATVDATGKWTATLPSSVLSTLPDGAVNVGVVVTDKAGNVVNTNASFNVVSNVLPSISLDALFGDGTLSIPELANALLSGTASGLAGRVLTIKIGNADAFTTNVDGSGHWSVNLPDAVKAVLQGLGSGNQSITITATDQYGNPASQTGSINVDLLTPVLNNVAVFGDNLLNVADSLVNQTITGLASNAPLGSTVQVSLGSKVFNGVIGANGSFTIAVSPADLAALVDGTFTPRVTITTPDGNSSTSDGAQPVIIGLKNLPTVVIDSLFGNDGFLNQAEAAVAQTITGKVTGMNSGQVTVTIGSTNYLANITNGTWSLALPAGALASIADGSLNVTATVRDAVGNIVSGNQVIGAIVKNVPTLGLNTLFGDGTLDLSDLLSNPILSGTSTNLALGTQIAIKVGALSFTTTVGANGQWQLTIPSLSLQGLLDGPLTVTATAKDVAGNVANVTQNALVAIQAVPTIIVNSLFGDGGLNLQELSTDQKITGTSTNAVGSTLTVSLGGKNYLATVGNDGSWSVNVPKGDLGALTDGLQNVSVAVTNAAGKVATSTSSLDVITHNLPTITLSSLFGNDGYLNISEAASGQVIGGKIGGVISGSTVVVTVGGVQLNATVDANGNWSATADKSLLQGLAAGSTKVGISVTDRVGNTTATETDVLVKLSQPTLSLTPVTNLLSIIGGVLTGLLGSAKLTLSGTSSNLEQGSIVHLNLVNLATATAIVGADGRWSTTLDVGLDLAKILSLSTIVNLYAADKAGNLAYLNVGLGGGNPTTTPPASTFAEEASTFSLMAASTAEESNSSAHTSTNSHSSTTTQGAQSTENTTESSVAATDSGYTIGGLSIDLADGTHQSGDSVQGGAGNDTIHLSALGFSEINGGAGTDTLVLDGVNLVLNLLNVNSKVENIEIIDLGHSGSNSVTLGVNEALNITDRPEDDLLIKGGLGDQVNLKHGNTDIWQISGQREVDGVQFDVYHNSSQTNTLGDVLIQQGLHVNMV
ncbi:Ig-like domain-containing protein [Salmonella enterica]